MREQALALLLAVGVAACAFLLYRSTMLPDVELGDSASFQTMVGSRAITPRDAYPLYFALGRLFLATGGSRARALNLASVVEGALAAGAIALLAAMVARSAPAGAAAALLFAVSYTFWSQSVIAEVYALHALLVALTLLLALRWSERPSQGRLAWFFGVYALSFGNHLSMILLAPGCVLFVCVASPRGWRAIVQPRTLLVAALLAAGAALQYAWNFGGLWASVSPPRSLAEALASFWFDVTKSDWRDAMVLEVPPSMYLERARMYGFDLVQQFGRIPLALAVVGAARLIRSDRPRAALILGVYGAALLFALGYNVGDAHVFFLTSHLTIALMAAAGLASLARWTGAPKTVAALAFALAAGRMYADYPALDRSGDRRPEQLLAQLTAGADDRTLLLTDLNWQVQNGLTYYAQETRPDLVHTRLADVLLYAPALVRDNLAIGRSVAVTARAKTSLERSYGPLFSFSRDERAPVRSVGEVARSLEPGTRYVLAILRPSSEFPLSSDEVADLVATLTGGRLSSLALDRYAAIAGLVGEAPVLLEADDRPFRRRVRLDSTPVTVRMESWLEFDTIRRMGFGHIVAGRRHAQILERGVNLVAFDAAGVVVESAYGSGIYAPSPRYLVDGAWYR